MNYILKNIKSFIKTDRTIFFITLISIIVSSLIMILSYGLYNNYNNEKNEIEVFPESLCGKGTENLTKSRLTEVLLSVDSEITEQTDMIYCNSTVDDHVLDFRFSISGNNIINAESFVRNYNSSLKLSGRYFNDEEMLNGSKVAVVYSEPDKNIRDTSVIIDNEEYEIIGTTWFSYWPLIPFTSLKDDAVINNVEILPKNSVTREMYNEFFSKSEGIIEFERPQINDKSDISFNNNLIMISVLISVISGINFASLYKYIILKRKKELAVFILCGCTLLKAVFLYLSECIIIATLSFVFSALLFDKFLKIIISNYLSDITEMYSIKVYSVIYLIYITVSIVFLIFVIYRIVNSQIRNLVSEG